MRKCQKVFASYPVRNPMVARHEPLFLSWTSNEWSATAFNRLETSRHTSHILRRQNLLAVCWEPLKSGIIDDQFILRVGSRFAIMLAVSGANGLIPYIHTYATYGRSHILWTSQWTFLAKSTITWLAQPPMPAEWAWNGLVLYCIFMMGCNK